MRAILDAMVWVRGLVGRRANSHAQDILVAWSCGEFTSIAGQPLLDEIERTLRDLSDLREMVLRLTLAQIASASVLVPSLHQRMGCRDPQDDHILEAAVLGGVDVIVTADHDLLNLPPHVEMYLARRGIRVLTVSDFATELKARRIAAGYALLSDLEEPQPPFSCLLCDHVDHADAECTTAWLGDDKDVVECSCLGWTA